MKVLLLHASLGAGHKRAAMALQEAFQEKQVAAEIADLLDFLPPPMGRLYSWAYDFMINDARWLWKAFYEYHDRPKTPYAPARAITQRWQFNRLLRFLQSPDFTHVIATHFTPVALLADWRTSPGLSQKLYSMVTDFVSHRCWKRAGMDHYFVAHERVAKQLAAAGIPADRITVTGIPVSPAFSSPLTRLDARVLWQCDPEDTVLLVLTSGLKLSLAKDLLLDLKRLPGKIRFLVSAGKDPSREKIVKRLVGEDARFTVFGFSPRIAEMMKAADLVVSKPGGLTVSESLACGLPQLLFSPIPGQEEANARYSVDSGAAMCIEAGPGRFEKVLSELMADRPRLTRMSEAAVKAGRPYAAGHIVETILKDRSQSA